MKSVDIRLNGISSRMLRKWVRNQIGSSIKRGDNIELIYKYNEWVLEYEWCII